jgi:hypothetical protein
MPRWIILAVALAVLGLWYFLAPLLQRWLRPRKPRRRR